MLTDDVGRSVASGESGGSLAERISELGVVDVRTKRELDSLVAYLLGDRGQPVVALAAIGGVELAVLAPRSVRVIVGPGPPIYAILQEGLLRRLTDALGSALTLTAGAARIWWPGLASSSDPRDHPLVSPLEVERAGGLLEEFARRFDLSRPRVREEIGRLEKVRAALERQLEARSGTSSWPASSVCMTSRPSAIASRRGQRQPRRAARVRPSREG